MLRDWEYDGDIMIEICCMYDSSRPCLCGWNFGKFIQYTPCLLTFMISWWDLTLALFQRTFLNDAIVQKLNTLVHVFNNASGRNVFWGTWCCRRCWCFSRIGTEFSCAIWVGHNWLDENPKATAIWKIMENTKEKFVTFMLKMQFLYRKVLLSSAVSWISGMFQKPNCHVLDSEGHFRGAEFREGEVLF